MDAATVIGGARGRDRPRFADVAADHLDDVYRYLLYVVKNPSLAEDLAADTFERALRSWARFEPRRASAKTWLCQVARSTALDHFRSEERRRRREDRYADENRTEFAELDVVEGLSTPLEQALAELSAAEREVIALRVILELDGDSTARVLGISRTACSTRLSRALAKLERKVESHATV